MKKVTLTLIALLGFTAMMAQTIVPTTPMNRNVVLEEFTGINCVNCPDGHRIANLVKAANPTRVSLINIHQESYATPSTGQPDYRTQWGNAIAGQTSLTGYPAGTVNRHLFPGLSQNTVTPGTAISRGNWTNASNQIMAQASYVNVAATATVDVTTRLMTVYVELYYTGNGPAQNLLNVALLQNNVIGPQVGASYNPSYVVPPNLYRHMHMLRHLLTGQWGDEILKTSAGTFVPRTYTYTLPAHITNIELALDNLEVIAFIAEGQQVIITGAEAAITYINFTFIDNPSAEQMFVYPNPANDILFVAGGEGYNTLQIYNIVGQLAKTVGNFSSQKGQAGIYVGDLTRGVYIVKLNGDDRETTTRLVISR